MDDRRSEVRMLCADMVEVRWKDRLGHQRGTTAILEDICPSGACLQVEELMSIRNYVNRNFSGWQLGAARRELLRRMLQERALYAAAMSQLQMLCRKGLLEVDTS